MSLDTISANDKSGLTKCHNMPMGAALQAVRSRIMSYLVAITLYCGRLTLDSCCSHIDPSGIIINLFYLLSLKLIWKKIFLSLLSVFCPLRIIAVPLSKCLGVKDRIRIRPASIPKLETFYKQNNRQPTQVRISVLPFTPSVWFAHKNLLTCVL